MEQVLVRFRLIGDEAKALQKLSAQEMRHPREQTRYILRQELQKRGLLSSDHDAETVPNRQPVS
jgi:hypothetical protein